MEREPIRLPEAGEWQEVDAREFGGIKAFLMWHSKEKYLNMIVYVEAEKRLVSYEVANDRAMEALEQPKALAIEAGVY